MISPSSDRPRSPLLWLILPFAAGIAASHRLDGAFSLGTAALFAAGALILGGAALAFFPRIWGALIGLALFAVGGVHHQVHRNPLPEWSSLPSREAVLTVRITRDFGANVTDRYQNVLGLVVRATSPVEELLGQTLYIRVQRPLSSPDAIQRGATVKLIGHLAGLDSTELEDDFERYLHSSGHNFLLRQARWLQTVEPPSRYAQIRREIKQDAAATLARGLQDSPRLTAALTAMLLGEKYRLDDATRTTFLRSGTMHLFAISGLHIGVIAIAINGLLRLFRVNRRIAFLIGSIVLLGYVDLIGLTPSAVRAWIMITCFHGARVLRAPGNSVAAISTSALIVLLMDPMQLFSAGFQMSYSVVFVLLLHGLALGRFAQPLMRPWRHLPAASLSPQQRFVQKRSEGLTMAVAFTWSASLIGMITGVGIFGWFSPLAFLANLALIPLAFFAINAGFASMVLGLVGASPIALIFNHAGALVLAIMLALLESPFQFAAGIPATFRIESWDEFGIIAVLVAVVVSHESTQLPAKLKWSLPSLVTLLVLVFGLKFS
ncbi:MAG: hypothetical protein SynsKO_38150 [Synoicihabitans sp.]